jgi:oligopeptide/dipeptide ABC transporter ATP-binding protein
MDKDVVRKRAIELLEIVQIRRPEVVLKQYPYQLSGGMKQRVMIACAIARDPKLIVADEPTTGLDVTVQAEIMQLLKQIRKDLNTSIILVSHDLPLINEVCDDIVIMHAGATVEKIPSAKIKATRHPYTEALYRSRIDLVEPRGKLVTIKGQPPTVGDWPTGCRFAGRCDYAKPECSADVELPMISLGANQVTQCIRHAEIWGK